jgi:hypothetical protein
MRGVTPILTFPRSSVSKALIGITVTILGIIQALAWHLYYDPIIYLFPGVTMKFATAWGFIFCGGVSVLLLEREFYLRSVLSVGLLILVLVMAADPSVFEIFALGDKGEMSIGPGIPSWGTVTAFGLVGLAGLMGWRKLFRVVELMGWIALLGYLVGAPLLYYYHPEYSTAMAIATALGFILVGRVRP